MGETRHGVSRKQSTPYFPKNKHFLPLIRTREGAYPTKRFQPVHQQEELIAEQYFPRTGFNT